MLAAYRLIRCGSWHSDAVYWCLMSARTCEVCGTNIEHRPAFAKYCTRNCGRRSAKSRETYKKYFESPAGKAARKRYNESEKGKETVRRLLEIRKQRRATARAEREALKPPPPPPEPHLCAKCGADILHRTRKAKYCVSCAAIAQREDYQRYMGTDKGKAARERAAERSKRRATDQNSETDAITRLDPSSP